MAYYPLYSTNFTPTPIYASHLKEPHKPTFLIRDEICPGKNVTPFPGYSMVSRLDRNVEGRDHRKKIQNPFTSTRSFIQLISPPKSPKKPLHFIQRMNYQIKYNYSNPEMQPIIYKIYDTFGPTPSLLQKNKSNLSIIDELTKINVTEKRRPVINYTESKVVSDNEGSGFIQESDLRKLGTSFLHTKPPIFTQIYPPKTITVRGREYYLADVDQN